MKEGEKKEGRKKGRNKDGDKGSTGKGIWEGRVLTVRGNRRRTRNDERGEKVVGRVGGKGVGSVVVRSWWWWSRYST